MITTQLKDGWEYCTPSQSPPAHQGFAPDGSWFTATYWSRDRYTHIIRCATPRELVQALVVASGQIVGGIRVDGQDMMVRRASNAK